MLHFTTFIAMNTVLKETKYALFIFCPKDVFQIMIACLQSKVICEYV